MGPRKRWLAGVVLGLTVALGVAHRRDAGATQEAEGKPKLILLVVVDQLRADYLERFAGRFGAGGFARLKREGAHFINCHSPYAITVTAPGHATLSTGTTPDRHGIAGNAWFDWKRNRGVHAVFDDYHRTVSEAGGGSRETGTGNREPEPGAHTCKESQVHRPEAGATGGEARNQEASASPCQLVAGTLGDELKLAHPGAKVFGVSWKDRAAILSAGKAADGAYWFDGHAPSTSSGQAGGFVTSTYYRDALPAWVAEFNRREIDSYAGRTWGRGDKVFGELVRSAEQPRAYYQVLAGSPLADELVEKLAERLLAEEDLGADGVPDLLAVSFSAMDYVGHRYGPYSEEVEELAAELDRTLAKLLAVVERRVGRGNYWVALSADHGVAPTLAQARTGGLPAKNVPSQEIRGRILRALEERWPFDSAQGKPFDSALRLHPSTPLRAGSGQAQGKGKDDWLVPRSFGAGAIVFNRVALIRHGVRVEDAARVAGEAALQTDGVVGYVGPGLSNLPGGYAEAFALSSYPGRNADVELLLEPYALMDGARGDTTHGTPYRYDTHVPLILFGPAFRAGVYAEPVTPADLAPTLAAALGMAPPAAASGRVLGEALKATGETPLGFARGRPVPLVRREASACVR